MIGKIERVPLREIWKREALDFTTWLEDNIALSEHIRGAIRSLIQFENNHTNTKENY